MRPAGYTRDTNCAVLMPFTLKKPVPETGTSFWYRIEHVLSDTRIWYQKKIDARLHVIRTIETGTSFSGILVYGIQVSRASVTGIRHFVQL